MSFHLSPSFFHIFCLRFLFYLLLFVDCGLCFMCFRVLIVLLFVIVGWLRSTFYVFSGIDCILVMFCFSFHSTVHSSLCLYPLFTCVRLLCSLSYVFKSFACGQLTLSVSGFYIFLFMPSVYFVLFVPLYMLWVFSVFN